METALPIYEEGRWAESSAFLGRLLASDGRVATKLCDPGGSLDRSVGLVKMLMRHEPRFDASFAKILLSDTKLTEAERQRGLAVLEKLGSAGRLTPILIQFLRDPRYRRQV